MRPQTKAKTHTAALAIIPPEGLWEPVQAIRRRHDRQMRRWMPHIMLLYPFRCRERSDAAAGLLAQACARIAPFAVTLSRFQYFDHGHESYTVWLGPEPAQPVIHLHEALWEAFPDCDDVRGFEGGFAPHLSVAQVDGRRDLQMLMGSLQRRWQPLTFTVADVAMVYRGRIPNDVFLVDRTVQLTGT